jgi:hypothetical protein
MFAQLSLDKRKQMVSFCCKGANCRGDDPLGKVFFQFLAGQPFKNNILWLRLGRDEEYVMNPVPPSSDEEHWRVVEELRA